MEILTFDGFGYHYYSKADGGIPKYYKKYDYLDKYAGTYFNANQKEGSVEKIVIYKDGCITRYLKDSSMQQSPGYGFFTTQVILEGNKLTFKGSDRATITFNADGSATYTYSDGKQDTLK